jgi:hypothetical protein
MVLGLLGGCGSSGPAAPLKVTGAISIEADDTALVVLTTADSLDPLHAVTDAKVTINGVTIPASAQGGYLFQGASPVQAGADVILKIERGGTLSAQFKAPGRVVFTAPPAGSVQDPAHTIQVAWTAPAVLPDEYELSVPSTFTGGIGWSETVVPPETTSDILAYQLDAGQTGIYVKCQSVRRVTTFDGETLDGTLVQLNVRDKSDTFSTQ